MNELRVRIVEELKHIFQRLYSTEVKVLNDSEKRGNYILLRVPLGYIPKKSYEAMVDTARNGIEQLSPELRGYVKIDDVDAIYETGLIIVKISE